MHINRLFTLFVLCSPIASCVATESTKQIEESVQVEYLVEDQRLNVAYSKLRKNLDFNAKQNLLRMQRAWVQYRDKKCDYAFPPTEEYGSIAKTENTLCKTTATILQTRELNRLSRIGVSKSLQPQKSKDYPIFICQLFSDQDNQECLSHIRRNEQIIINFENVPESEFEVKSDISPLPFTNKQIDLKNPNDARKSDFPLTVESYIKTMGLDNFSTNEGVLKSSYDWFKQVL